MQDFIQQTGLPIIDVLQELQTTLEQNSTVILCAPPGAGKSTVVPLELLGAYWLSPPTPQSGSTSYSNNLESHLTPQSAEMDSENFKTLGGGQLPLKEGEQLKNVVGKIIMLEPRRLAAKTVAMRMADLLGEQVGETVGYRIRFETKVSSKTKIEVVTEGILTRMLQSDNSLEGVGLVIFDEFHERSIYADVALALCREAQQILRNDLRILIMSATLNLEELKKLLNAPVVESLGKQYPVEIIYTDQQDERMMAEMTANVATRALKECDGDILIFLPGEGEIKKCEEILSTQIRDVEIHPLYGQLPPGKQMAAIFPSRSGKRKIVIATSIAETSLTIEGIKVVIDSGFGRVSRFDPKSGLSRLETIQISKDSADQRAGRAGRLSPGTCYRLWSKPVQAKLAAHRTPEILEADLASLVLDMAQWGVSTIYDLTWLTPPPQHGIKQATELLHELNALENNKITEHGKKMHDLPCHPRIAHMMLMAQSSEGTGRDQTLQMIALASDIAALLEERDPLPRDSGIDINLRIEALRRWRKSSLGPSTGGRPLSGSFAGGGKFGRIVKIAESYRALFKSEENNDAVDPYETGVLLVYAYPERIAFARPGNNAQFQLSNGKLAMASHKDDLAHEPWLAIANMDARDGMGKIFMASPLNPQDLVPLLKERDIIIWNSKKGGLVANRETRIGSIILKSIPLPNPEKEKLTEAILDVIKKEGEHLLDWNETVTQFQNRILSLQKWNPEQVWPDLKTTSLLASVDTWLAPYLIQIRNEDDLKKLNLADILFHFLDYEKQNLLNKLAPKQIEVPSGSNITLTYSALGSDPILAVRIQEVFGLEDTPTVNQQKNKILLHLLSPAYKPVQITSDLRNFWKNTYFDVKKELKPRYPKHAWPEDPWNHPAIRGTKKQNGLK